MKAFVTGCTGTLGTAVVSHLLREGHEVTGFSRCELKQSQYLRHPKLTLYLGDIRDQNRVSEASRGADKIFHFAALKHVDIIEDNPEESVYTNILGTMNMLHAQRVNRIPRLVFTSTDKAAYPINVYGASKLISERLVLRNPNNVVCRYGNVLASRGSVVEKFAKSLRLTKSIEVTDPNMSRFWITATEAARFVIASSEAKEGEGGLRVPTMKSAPLSSIVRAVTEIMGIDAYHTTTTPIRKGEKLHECLKTEFDGEEVFSNQSAQFTLEEIKKILFPLVRSLLT